MRAVYIVSSVRTAVGKAKKGTLRNFRSDDLGAIAVKAALEKVPELQPEQIDNVIIGCAAPEAEQGWNIGRIIVKRAGLPDSVPGCTVNLCCASGLQTIAIAANAIQVGQAEAIVAGGTESMSFIPELGGSCNPNLELVETSPDLYLGWGLTAENVADKYAISREEQDRFAFRSHQRALAAIDGGKFESEIVPVKFTETSYIDGNLETVEKVFQVDEGPRRDTSLEAMARLKSVFREGGTVTAGNSSQLSDGAAAVVLMSEDKVKELGVQPIARLLGYAVAGVPPEIMGIGPTTAVPKVLKQVGLKLEDIGLIELNEAFAAQSIAVIRELGLNEEIVNVNGGAIALGHPLGCTGAKLTATLLHEMKRRGVRYGLCTMCIGGGMGAAAVFENQRL